MTCVYRQVYVQKNGAGSDLGNANVPAGLDMCSLYKHYIKVNRKAVIRN